LADFPRCAMLAPIPCPEIDDLRRFLVGEATDEDFRRVQDHLRKCIPCRNKLKFLEEARAEDTLEPVCGPDHSTQASTFARRRAADPKNSAADFDWLGPYRVLCMIGQGGMGTVYKAEDPRLGRLVAIKVPHSSKVGPGDSTGRQRFLREARVAA